MATWHLRPTLWVINAKGNTIEFGKLWFWLFWTVFDLFFALCAVFTLFAVCGPCGLVSLLSLSRSLSLPLARARALALSRLSVFLCVCVLLARALALALALAFARALSHTHLFWVTTIRHFPIWAPHIVFVLEHNCVSDYWVTFPLFWLVLPFWLMSLSITLHQYMTYLHHIHTWHTYITYLCHITWLIQDAVMTWKMLDLRHDLRHERCCI